MKALNILLATATMASASSKTLLIDKILFVCQSVPGNTVCTERETGGEKLTIDDAHPEYFIHTNYNDDGTPQMTSKYYIKDVKAFDYDEDGESDYYVFNTISNAKNRYFWTLNFLNKTITTWGWNNGRPFELKKTWSGSSTRADLD